MIVKKIGYRIRVFLQIINAGLLHDGSLKCAPTVFLGKRVEIKPKKGSLICLLGSCVISNDCVLEAFGGGKIFIEERVFMNNRTQIVAKEAISIGKETTIGPNVMIYDHDHAIGKKNEYVSAPIVIGKNVWIGAGAIILKGVRIGDHAVVAAGAIVTNDIPEGFTYINKITPILK